MKCVILAGGLGTRLAEETTTKPKPMVKIGNYPIILHIMKIYRSHGIKEFVICTGYKHTIILNYFKKFLIKKNKKICEYYDHINDLKISCIYTGKKTNTAGLDKKPRWTFIGLEDARLQFWNNELYQTGVRRDTTRNGEGRMELSTIKNMDRISNYAT